MGRGAIDYSSGRLTAVNRIRYLFSCITIGVKGPQPPQGVLGAPGSRILLAGERRATGFLAKTVETEKTIEIKIPKRNNFPASTSTSLGGFLNKLSDMNYFLNPYTFALNNAQYLSIISNISFVRKGKINSIC